MPSTSHNAPNHGSLASPATSPAPLAKPRLHRGTSHYLHDGPPPEVFLTAGDVRNRWRVSGMFIWRMRRAGKLTAYKIGTRGVRFALAEIEQIERNAKTTGEGVAQ